MGCRGAGVQPRDGRVVVFIDFVVAGLDVDGNKLAVVLRPSIGRTRRSSISDPSRASSSGERCTSLAGMAWLQAIIRLHSAYRAPQVLSHVHADWPTGRASKCSRLQANCQIETDDDKGHDDGVNDAKDGTRCGQLTRPVRRRPSSLKQPRSQPSGTTARARSKRRSGRPAASPFAQESLAQRQYSRRNLPMLEPCFFYGWQRLRHLSMCSSSGTARPTTRVSRRWRLVSTRFSSSMGAMPAPGRSRSTSSSAPSVRLPANRSSPRRAGRHH